MLPSTTVAVAEHLAALLPDDFSRTVLNGSLRALLDDNNPIRVNLLALGIREMVRHVLEVKAPDEAIRSCVWFKEAMQKKVAKMPLKEAKAADVVTRKDRMVYATQGGLRDETLSELNIDVEGMHSELISTVKMLSKHVHIEELNMLPPASSPAVLAEEVIAAVTEFLESIARFRSEVGDAVSEAVQTEALDTFLRETVDSLDELSSHTQVEDVEVAVVDVIGIGPSEVSIEASGTVYVELVYGSSSDERRGDGARMSAKYPFRILLTASTENLANLESGSAYVNTDSFYK